MKTLKQKSHKVCDAARRYADGAWGDWNNRFAEAVEAHGFELVPFYADLHILDRDDPIMAPEPYDKGGLFYTYPSVIAPKGWRPKLR